MTEAPVQAIPTDPKDATPEQGIALCLSGGGYRAMVFHIGALWRLYESRLLDKINRISSVSGGSITAGLLALRWRELSFNPASLQNDFVPKVVGPLRRFACKTIDEEAFILDHLPFGSVSGHIAAAYDDHLFKGATLQDLPDEPRFVINATNVQSGVLWRFMKPYMRDYCVGEVKTPTVRLAQAVAASSAFPPVLSPLELQLDPATFTPNSGQNLQRQPFTELSHSLGWRSLRQSWFGDRMEAVPNDTRERRWSQSPTRRRASHGPDLPLVSRVRIDGQPGALIAQAATDRLVQSAGDRRYASQWGLLGHPH